MERRTNKILKMVRRIQQHEPYALLHLSMKYFWPETFNELYAAYFTGCPARSCVAVKQLPKGVLVEVEAIAAVR